MANDFAFEMAASAVRFGAGVTKLSPRPASLEELAQLFEDAMLAW